MITTNTAYSYLCRIRERNKLDEVDVEEGNGYEKEMENKMITLGHGRPP